MRENWEIHWKDYYEILQVHSSAEPEVIKAAYRSLAYKYHSDRNKGSGDERLKDLNEANDILSNPEKRKEYDSEFFLRKSGSGIRQQANQYAPPSHQPSQRQQPPPSTSSSSSQSIINIKCLNPRCDRFGKVTPMKVLFISRKPAFATCPVCKTAHDIRTEADRPRMASEKEKEEEPLHWNSKPMKKRGKWF